ncbi:MAG: iron chelate uptake ABC transporter family permease subunit [archaeon]|nr:iron chelate uptake ABC transporter family permease subunit [archaeon]
MNKKLIMALAVASISILALLQFAPASEADGTVTVLIDKGNGQTYWTEGTGSTLDEILGSVCDSMNMKFSSNGDTIKVDGRSDYTIGSTTARWTYYEYDSEWTERTYSGGDACGKSFIAIGFYPSGIVPTVTPEYKTAWTAIHGDALNSGNTNNYDASSDEFTLSFTYSNTENPHPSCYSSPLFANGHLYFNSVDYGGLSGLRTRVASFDAATGHEDWNTDYAPAGYSLATGAIYAGNLYQPTNFGKVFLIHTTGADAGEVVKERSYTLPTNVPPTHSTVMQGVSSIVYDSGHLFMGSSSGNIACITPDLQEVWKTQLPGAVYPSTSVSVVDGYVYVGACDGSLYILSEKTGELVTSITLYSVKDSSDPDLPEGRVGTPAVIGNKIFVSYNDGLGMSSVKSAFAVLNFSKDTGTLTKVNEAELSALEIQGNYLVISPDSTCVYALGDDNLYRINLDGTFTTVGTVSETHGGLTFVNSAYFYATDYDSAGGVVIYDTTGKKIASADKPAIMENFSMGSTLIAGPYLCITSDSGAAVFTGSLADNPPPAPPVPPEPFHEPADTTFLIADGTGFYTTIKGTGNTVMEAFENAVDAYGYKNDVTYSGGAESHTNVASIFNLGLQPVDSTHMRYWVSCVWSADAWTLSSNLMNKMYADDNSSFLLYYGVSDGMSVVIPENIPGGDKLVTLTMSDAGTRFLIESPAGGYLKINGTGNSVRDAFVNACRDNAIPLESDGDDFIIFGLSNSSAEKWNNLTATAERWNESNRNMSEIRSSDIPLYGLCYGAPGSMPTMSPSSLFEHGFPTAPGKDMTLTYVGIGILVAILAVICAFLVHIKRTQEMPVFAYIRTKLRSDNANGSKVRRNKTRLLIVCLLGLTATFIMFLCSLAIGPTAILSLPDALSALMSAVGKHGQNLNFQEIIVYESRLPRAIATLGVGIGLSIAGCVYQAIIRNPLVDPYIMGVSSGAGTFAVAAIAANFTFFGLLANNNFATPILAIIGGLLAFGLTLLIAEKAGGSSTNYVLAGVVIGLVFSAVQTMLLVTSDSNKLTSAMSWLFGSFANISWSTVWIVFFPALFLALVPLFWAKELNLVLLGEDQAKQMGLNVRKFNRWMLILASVLTSVCVAFVGIIGFVGMVIPHLARMVLGGDHRLVLPASIMMGGALMLFADLLAKMLMVPTELPVGAITTVIGVPVFAYLLIKKGRMYSG